MKKSGADAAMERQRALIRARTFTNRWRIEHGGRVLPDFTYGRVSDAIQVAEMLDPRQTLLVAPNGMKLNVAAARQCF